MLSAQNIANAEVLACLIRFLKNNIDIMIPKRFHLTSWKSVLTQETSPPWEILQTPQHSDCALDTLGKHWKDAPQNTPKRILGLVRCMRDEDKLPGSDGDWLKHSNYRNHTHSLMRDSGHMASYKPVDNRAQKVSWEA